MFSIIYKLSRKYNIASKILRLLFGCDIPTKALIGKNVAFLHAGFGTVVHQCAIIGDDCKIQHHVTIGVKANDNLAPTIGKNVFIAPYAMILGGITIGDNCIIGANSFITKDVPPNKTVYNYKGELVIKDN